MKLICGDSLEILKKATPNSVDAIVTDPPYGLSFMGKKWDYDVPSVEIWKECYRVLKPGGYLLSFAGTRTQHRMAVNIEDAGFEIRDMIAWVYGSGFPKSLNIGKAVDKLQGNEREYISTTVRTTHKKGTSYEWAGGNDTGICDYTKGNSEWEGWGTALKPALEPITVARKPLSEKTVAENVLKWGTGGINIDGSRVGTEVRFNAPAGNTGDEPVPIMKSNDEYQGQEVTGRFPANLIHDGSDEVVSLFPETGKSQSGSRRSNNGNPFAVDNEKGDAGFGDSGSAARFFKQCELTEEDIWEQEKLDQIDVPINQVNPNSDNAPKRFLYQPKASKADRDEGLDGFEDKANAGSYEFRVDGSLDGKPTLPKKNLHPTVKPTKLMQYLVKLVTPKGGVVLDPFMGSGSTGKACKLEGFDFIGIEREPEYVEIAKARIENF